LIPHSRTTLKHQDFRAVNSALTKGMLTLGSQNYALGMEFGEYVGAEYTRITNSGTMAFYLILKALDITNEDEVLLPDYICSSLLGPLEALKAVPVLYDNQQRFWLSGIDTILSKITKKTRVVVINHTFGLIFNQVKDLLVGLPRDVLIVEDCCHTIISNKSYLKKYVSEHSLCSFYSFNATKVLASGEGGAISTNNKTFAQELNQISIGDNLSDLNCSLARSQLKRLDSFIQKRQSIAQVYLRELKGYVHNDINENSGIFYRFPLFVANNLNFWKSKQVTYRKGVDSLLSEHLNLLPEPNAKELFECTVSIPIYPSLTFSEIKLIMKETKKNLQQ
jgi:perosamine synthetase